MTILFTPLDIPVELPNVQDLYNWAIENSFRQNNYKQFELGWFTHSPVACCIQPNDWRDVSELYRVEDHLKNQYLGTGTVFHPEFEKLFPTIVEAIKAMPFKELTGASVKIQYGPTFAHKDDIHTIEDDGLCEPKRITMLLTEIEHSTLWLETDQRYYPKIPPSYPVYAFNNHDCFHGSDFKEGRIRMILDTAGMLDASKHRQLLNRSIEKFKDYVVKF